MTSATPVSEGSSRALSIRITRIRWISSWKRTAIAPQSAPVMTSVTSSRRRDIARARSNKFTLRRLLPRAPLWIGSGVTPDVLPALIRAGVDGLIVGSWTQRDGRAGAGVDAARARRLAVAAGEAAAGTGPDDG